MASESKYISIRNDLIERIKAGEFPDGKLPSIKNIAEEYQVSLMTANHTVKDLKSSGIVICYPDTRGTLINRKQLNILQESNDTCNLMENIKIYARKKFKIRYFNPEYFSQAKATWDEIIESFQRRYPWIEVEIFPEKDLNDMIAENDYPDVMQITGRDLNFRRRQGQIMSLDKFIRTDDPFLQELHPKALENTMFDDELFALPVSIGMPLLFYRKDILDDCSISSESVTGGSWSNVMEILESLAGKKYETALKLGLWSYWNLFIGDTSTAIFKRNFDNLLLNSIEILRNFYSRNAYFLYGNGPMPDDAFFRKKGAAFFAYSSFIKDFKKYPGWRISRMPFEKSGVLTSETCVNCICSKSQRPEDAWFFIRYLSSEETQRKIAESGNNFPVHGKLLREINEYPEFSNMNISKLLTDSRRLSINSQTLYILYDSIIDPILESHFAGKLPARSVLDIIRPRVDEILKVYIME